jgi:hypothetical protein
MAVGVNLLAAAALGAILLATGARLRRLLKLPVWPALRLPIDLMVGSWLFACLVLVLGLAHLWRTATLVGLALALAAAGGFRHSGWRWRPALPTAVGGLIILPLALTPPFFYDALVYHLGLPWQALMEGGLLAHREDLFATFPPLSQLVDAPLLALGLDRAPAALHWLTFVAAGAAVFALARALRAPRWGAILAAAAFPLLPCHALVPALPAAEAWYVGGVLSSLALVARRRWPPGTILASGLLAGIATAARLQGIAWGCVILGVVLVRGRRWKKVAGFIAAWTAGAGPWWLKNLVLLRDPVAPLLWRREGVVTLWRDAGVALHTCSGAGEFLRATLAALAPHTSYLAVLFAAALLAVTGGARACERTVGLATAAGVVAWALTGNLPRFLSIPAALLLVLSAGAGRRGGYGRLASALALATAALVSLVFSTTEVMRWRPLAAVSRTLANVRPEMVANNPFAAFTAAGRLSRDARVLFVGEPRGFAFPRRFVAPSQVDISPLRPILEQAHSVDEACRVLRAEGFTHLLVNWGELARLAPTYPVAPWRDLAGRSRWRTFIAFLGPPVVEANGVQVFDLTASKSRESPR